MIQMHDLNYKVTNMIFKCLIHKIPVPEIVACVKHVYIYCIQYPLCTNYLYCSISKYSHRRSCCSQLRIGLAATESMAKVKGHLLHNTTTTTTTTAVNNSTWKSQTICWTSLPSLQSTGNNEVLMSITVNISQCCSKVVNISQCCSKVVRLAFCHAQPHRARTQQFKNISPFLFSNRSEVYSFLKLLTKYFH